MRVVLTWRAFTGDPNEPACLDPTLGGSNVCTSGSTPLPADFDLRIIDVSSAATWYSLSYDNNVEWVEFQAEAGHVYSVDVLIYPGSVIADWAVISIAYGPASN